MIPRSVEDLKRRHRGLARIAEATVGLMGRTPDYMNVKFAGLRRDAGSDWAGRGRSATRRAPDNLVAFQKRLRARRHLADPHDHPPDHRQGDRLPDRRQPGAPAQGRRDRGRHRRARRPHPGHAGSVRRRASRSTRRIRCRPTAEAYALAFSIPMDTPGLMFLCRDSAAAPGAAPVRPARCRPASTSRTPSCIFDDVEMPARAPVHRRRRRRLQHA